MFGFSKKVKDPVCGMTVDPRTAISRAISGKTYYFCSEECAKAYEDKLSRVQGHQDQMHKHEEDSHACC